MADVGKFIDELLPLLNAAANKAEEARVLIIKGPKVQQPIDPDDFGFRKNPSTALAQTKATCVYNNIMIEVSFLSIRVSVALTILP